MQFDGCLGICQHCHLKCVRKTLALQSDSVAICHAKRIFNEVDFFFFLSWGIPCPQLKFMLQSGSKRDQTFWNHSPQIPQCLATLPRGASCPLAHLAAAIAQAV